MQKFHFTVKSTNPAIIVPYIVTTTLLLKCFELLNLPEVKSVNANSAGSIC